MTSTHAFWLAASRQATGETAFDVTSPGTAGSSAP